MPIRIDLLAEDHAAEEIRRRDPVKRATYVAGVLVAAVVAYCAMQQVRLMSLSREIAAYKAKWTNLEDGYQEATENLRAAAELEHNLQSLYKFSTNRFLWGPVLETLQYSDVSGVRLTRIEGEQAFESVAEEKTEEGKITTPAQTSEKIKLWLDGRDVSPSAGAKVNSFRQKIASLPFFAAHLEPVNGIRLTDLTPPQEDPGNPGRSYVQFTLECTFPERITVAKP